MVLGRTPPQGREARYDISESTGGVSVRAVIIYESMFGNTHAIADAIAKP
jgi:flavorubredoxin